MARFTFHARNAAGLRRLPLYLLGALATLVVPRTDRLWAFGCGIGPGEGALPLLRLARERLPARVRLVWLATTDDELHRARDLGLDAVRKLSATGFWLTLRARVLVVTHGLGDVNRYAARGGFVVQLWHGVPLKRLHLDAPVASSAGSRLGRAVVRRGFRVVGRQIDLFPVASAPVVDRVHTAFGVAREHVVVTGDPRDDVLLRGTRAERRAAASTLLQTAIGRVGEGPVVMYAPTWRDGDPDPAVPSAHEWGQIVAWLDAVDGTLVVRNHPLGRADYAAGPALSPRVRLLDARTLADLTPVLPAIDHLVTDYSSTAFDFALVDGTTVYLAVDVDSYLATRGLYEPYERFTGGREVRTWSDALDALSRLVAGDPVAIDHARTVRDEHFDWLDGHATDRVLAEILRRTTSGPHAPAPTPEPRKLHVCAARIADDDLELSMDVPDGMSVRLVGARQTIDGIIDGSRVRLPLVISRWGTGGLALPSGDYRLWVGGDDRISVASNACVAARTSMFRAATLDRAGGLVLRVAAPLTDAERDGRRRFSMINLVRSSDLERAVLFESFYGRVATDNPAAIDAELAAQLPDLRRYWCVADRSVAVPDGAIPLVEGSSEWWRVQAAARVCIVNDWLRTGRRRDGQRVLQTWHGTMLKRLAIDRAGHSSRQRLAAARQGRRWDVLLAQNAYSAKVFRSSYAYRGPVWETGYPRTDVLAHPDRAAGVRQRLGVPAGARVVLYAPTWRDDRAGLVAHLDVVRFAAGLPDDHRLLVRGHSRTLGQDVDRSGERLVDVTTYPDVAELMLAADVLITDYSSVMFDFAVTGKPMTFYVPDIDHYGDHTRGFYFDLAAKAPGPVVSTESDLHDALAQLDTARYAERYAEWQRTFVPHDDGHAAQRVVQRLRNAGWFD